MQNNLPEFEEWIKELEKMELMDWERLPDIELYMDQVISYMERQVSPFKVTNEEKIITPSMINNYIKDGVVPKTVKKKYSKEHLVVLSIVCMLKQILPLQDLHKLMACYREEMDIEQIYKNFCDMQKEVIESMSEEISEAFSHGETSKEDLCFLAMRLAVGANAARIASQKIISYISSEKNETDEDAEKEKKE